MPNLGKEMDKDAWGNLDMDKGMNEVKGFLLANILQSVNAYSQKKPHRKWFRRSPNRKTQCGLDYMLVSKIDIAHIQVLNRINFGKGNCMIWFEICINFQLERNKMFHTKVKLLKVNRNFIQPLQVNI